MCGICGLYGFNDKALLHSMTNFLSHRGPDDSGFYIDDKISLGFRRLSIIDLKSGSQPVRNENGTAWVVFNGEIYNYQELRKTLESKGHKFYTNSDTECIIHAYEEYGKDCVIYLRGMFAFAIWDETKKQIFLARDRIGIKPLYYAWNGETLVFASEIKSILLFPGIKRQINKKALYYYLTFRFNPLHDTLFQGVSKLPPGHFLIYDGKTITLSKYWDLEFQSIYHTEEQQITMVKKLFLESVKSQMISDVPLGAYLSGGIDSSAVVAAMRGFSDEPVRTFSVGFPEKEHNELPYAKLISEKFGTDHHEFIIEPKAFEYLPNIIWQSDEPIADPAAIPTFILSKNTKKFCSVVLTGEGSDELFAGYEHYKIMLLGNKIKRIGPLKQLLKFGINKIPKNLLNNFFKYSSALGEEGIKRFNEYLNNLNDPVKAYLSIVSIFNKNEVDEISIMGSDNHTKSDIVEEISSLSHLHYHDDLLSTVQKIEFKTSLPEDLLMKVDRMTMAHGIEARVPFLDHHFVEMCSKIPSDMKIHQGIDKYVFRMAVKDLIPDEIRTRKKHRFFVPIDNWMQGEVGYVARNMIDQSVKKGLYDSLFVEKMFAHLKDSPLYASRQIWTLLTFEIWRRMFIESDKIYRPSELSIDKLMY